MAIPLYKLFSATTYDVLVSALVLTSLEALSRNAPRRNWVTTTDVRPSPPPCGWSTGFITTPRTVGSRASVKHQLYQVHVAYAQSYQLHRSLHDLQKVLCAFHQNVDDSDVCNWVASNDLSISTSRTSWSWAPLLLKFTDVYSRTYWDVTHRQSVTCFDWRINTRLDLVTCLNTLVQWCNDAHRLRTELERC